MVVQRSRSNGGAELGWCLLLTNDQGFCSQIIFKEGTLSRKAHVLFSLLWCFRSNLPASLSAAVWDYPCWDLALQQAWPCSLSHTHEGRWHPRCVFVICLTAGSAGLGVTVPAPNCGTAGHWTDVHWRTGRQWDLPCLCLG